MNDRFELTKSMIRDDYMVYDKNISYHAGYHLKDIIFGYKKTNGSCFMDHVNWLKENHPELMI